MKIKSTFTVKLEAPDEQPAIFTFKRAKLNDLLTEAVDDDAKGPDALRARLAIIFDYLIKVEGLEDENGVQLTVDQIKGLELDLVTINALVKGYNAALGDAGGDIEKKDS